MGLRSGLGLRCSVLVVLFLLLAACVLCNKTHHQSHTKLARNVAKVRKLIERGERRLIVRSWVIRTSKSFRSRPYGFVANSLPRGNTPPPGPSTMHRVIPT
ncbi:hypothetical protein O6H91_16G047700 [Diphasiastrum complanatum]|uniref:Uncharacterized protein n=1 Tax=Diphasiastrum complanatum TaxID=34168 RepID=A0ACC2BC56_DIPCM|nr:hypothetical protein O6H91_16G047700 [Diphasiastrum complanatum]